MDQALVDQARKDMEAKDENIFKLTKEVVELRLLRDETDAPSKTTRTTAEDSPVCKVSTAFIVLLFKRIQVLKIIKLF